MNRRHGGTDWSGPAFALAFVLSWVLVIGLIKFVVALF